jgi:hypothetical protein
MFSPAPRVRPTEFFVNTMSNLSIGDALRDIASANPASTAWATANQARYIPFRILSACTVLKLLTYNGATATGNTDVGVFDRNGVKLISSGATAQAGTSTWQAFDTTDTLLVPGLYYFGLLSSSTTATFFSYASKPAGQLLGVQSQAVGAGTLPSTATFAVLDAAIIPVVGLSLRTLI